MTGGCKTGRRINRMAMGTAVLALMLSTPAMAARGNADRAMQAYVEGRLAQASQDYGLAADRYALALKWRDDAIARRRSFDVAMISGNRKKAEQLAQRIALADESTPDMAVGDSIIALTRAAAAMRNRNHRDYAAAVQEFSAPGRGGQSGQMLAVLLDAWGEAARGNIDAALDLVDPAAARGLAQSYLQEHRAHILSFGRRWPEAAEAYGQLIEGNGANVTRLRLATVANLLQMASPDAEIREWLSKLLAEGPEHDPQLQAVRKQFDSRPSKTMLSDYLVRSPGEGLALMFIRLAADLSRERALGAGINFSRLATFSAPGMADGWLVTTDVLAMADRHDLALEALKSVPDNVMWRELIESRRISILIEAGREAEARKLLQQRLQQKGASASDWHRLAELERRDDRHAEAIAAYDQVERLLEADDDLARAQLHFLRGSVHERSRDWPAAERDLRIAVELRQENPVYLNYLGYSLLEYGGDLQEARTLIARAHRIVPGNGAITDSMGWAEHLLGNHEEAVRLLQEAQSAEPGDATIADHLGDALWTVGRRIEARHAWRSATALSPEPELAVMLQQKLDFGLDITRKMQPR